jgi:hypothetical protein
MRMLLRGMLCLLTSTIVVLVGGLPGVTSERAVGVVCHVKVLSDKVEDVSSMEAWKKSFIKEGMTDRQKALAAWEAVVKFQHQDRCPPFEYLAQNAVDDPIKTFNVYGYGICGGASANLVALARYAGLQARGWQINVCRASHRGADAPATRLRHFGFRLAFSVEGVKQAFQSQK